MDTNALNRSIGEIKRRLAAIEKMLHGSSGGTGGVSQLSGTGDETEPGEVEPFGCHENGLVYGTATPGSYLSAVFRCNDKVAKVAAIRALLAACGSTVTASQLCGGNCPDNRNCMPTTLQSDVTDDAELRLHGPDANGNCYYQLVIVSPGNVGWSALPGSCQCM